MGADFSYERWYAFCDTHRKRIEGSKFHGRFEPIETPERCEWKRELLMGDKRVHKCHEQAMWEFYARAKPEVSK